MKTMRQHMCGIAGALHDLQKVMREAEDAGFDVTFYMPHSTGVWSEQFLPFCGDDEVGVRVSKTTVYQEESWTVKARSGVE